MLRNSTAGVEVSNMNEYEKRIQNKEILGEVGEEACESKTKGCGGHCAGCGSRERIPTIWYIASAVAIIGFALLLKFVGLI
ncbi:MAG TPA: hypothetical protein GXZ89_05995 [Fastidiosipila sp.]|nr:hypothetical protein [Fastidiosipila sp.]